MLRSGGLGEGGRGNRWSELTKKGMVLGVSAMMGQVCGSYFVMRWSCWKAKVGLVGRGSDEHH